MVRNGISRTLAERTQIITNDSSEAYARYRYALETNPYPYSARSKSRLTVETTVSSYVLGRVRSKTLILKTLQLGIQSRVRSGV